MSFGKQGEFKKFLEKKGYDGLFGKTAGMGKQWVAFEPNQIKSVFNIKLDLNDKSIIGSLIAMGLIADEANNAK